MTRVNGNRLIIETKPSRLSATTRLVVQAHLQPIHNPHFNVKIYGGFVSPKP